MKPGRPNKSRRKLWFLTIPVVLIVAVAALILTHSGLGVDRNNVPKFIQTDFVDLSRIYSISKFRSAEGHDFSGGGETCRSMKHYFTPQYDATSTKDSKGLPPPPDGVTDISIFSPVDGTITQVSSERTPVGNQVYIVPDKAPQFTIRLFHVWVNKDVHGGFGPFGWGGSHVKAGQKIGVIGKSQGTDVAVQIGNMPWDENFVSYFSVMPDSVFASYQTRGVKSPDELIITKEYRDAHPVPCNQDQKSEQEFNYPAGYDHEADDVYLSGYQAPDLHKEMDSQNSKQSGQPAPVQNYGNNIPQGAH